MQRLADAEHQQFLCRDAAKQRDASSHLTNQMINLGGQPSSGSGWNVCLPPVDLQRGPAGPVPPALQGDPRYQEYLHCRYGDVPITPAMANAPALPVPPAAGGNPTAASAE